LEVSAYKNILMKKKELVVASRNVSLPQKQRQQAWEKIRQINEQLFQGISHNFKRLDESIRYLEQEEKISLDRTFFFGLFDKERLRTFASI
ncbi:hypothetical protein LCGC14_3056700, partial [marine sediment metagenome]